MRWNNRVSRIERDAVVITGPEGEERLPATFVYVMTGFATAVGSTASGERSDRCANRHSSARSGDTPRHRCRDFFIAGVVVAGYDANKVFIENGRYHGDRIVARLLGRNAPLEPKLSAELNT